MGCLLCCASPEFRAPSKEKAPITVSSSSRYEYLLLKLCEIVAALLQE